MEEATPYLEFERLMDHIAHQNQLLQSIINRLTVLEAQRLENEKIYLENQRKLIELLERREHKNNSYNTGHQEIFRMVENLTNVKLNLTDREIIGFLLYNNNMPEPSEIILAHITTRSPQYISNRISFLAKKNILEKIRYRGRKYLYRINKNLVDI